MNGKTAKLARRVAVRRGVHETVVKNEWRHCASHQAKGRLRRRLQNELSQAQPIRL